MALLERRSGLGVSGWFIANNSLLIDRALGKAAANQTIRMRNGFASGHADKVSPDLAGEQRAEQIDGAARLLAQAVHDAIERFLVAFDQIVEPIVETFEWFVVRGQRQHVGRNGAA